MFVLALVACSDPAPQATPAPAPQAAAADHTAPAPAAANGDWQHYGKPFEVAEASDCKARIAAPDAKVDQTVRVTGRIENVCQKAGCWMVIADDDGKYLRVSMKDHAFGVPTTTATGPDTRVDVEGKLIAKKLDAKTLEHLKSEAKGEGADLDKQFAPTYEIVATGVAVKKG
jgi:hypothetical protein